MRAEAELKVQPYLENLPQHELLYKHILLLQLMLLDAEALHEENPQKLGQVMDQVRKVAESSVLALRDLYGVEVEKIHLGNKGNSQKLLNTAAVTQLGFVNVPESLLDVNTNRLKTAAKDGADHFRGLLMASIYMAIRDPKHPLSRIAVTDPEFLMRLDKLFNISSKSVHPMSNLTYTYPQVEEIALEVLYTARKMLKP